MKLHLHLHGYRTGDAWEEGEHERGQPGNAGQFAAQHAAYHETLLKAGFKERTKSKFTPPGQYFGPDATGAEISKGHFKLRTITGKSWKSDPAHSEAERRADLEDKIKLATGHVRAEIEREEAKRSKEKSNQSVIEQPDLNQKQETAVEDYYQTDTAAPINGGKINRYLMGTGPATPEIKQAVKELDGLLDQCVVTTPLEVYRGIGNMDVSRYQPGDTVSDARFTSTSHDEEIAKQFARFRSGNLGGTRNKNPGRFVISLPVGAKAADMGNFGLGIGHTASGNEAEVLLPRNQKFKVKSVDAKTRTVHLEAVVGG